jgi:hypothetical protein
MAVEIRYGFASVIVGKNRQFVGLFYGVARARVVDVCVLIIGEKKRPLTAKALQDLLTFGIR